MKIAVIVLAVLIAGCATAGKRDWNPALAESDAQRDIAKGKIVIFYAGTIGVWPVGVPSGLDDLVAKAKKGDAGIGCIVEDISFREKQSEYAVIYNRAVLRFLLKEAGRSTTILDEVIRRETEERANQAPEPTRSARGPS